LFSTIKLKILIDDMRGKGMECGGRYGEEQTRTVFMGKHEEKRPLGRQKCSGSDGIIKTELKETGW